MDSHMLKMLKIINPDKDYPTNLGKKWTTEEEYTLLQELDKNINVEIIAQNHKRTIGGIRGRQRTIAYNMYLKNVSIEEIVKITKLDKETITETILKITNPDPTNLGKKWTTEEEYTLLQELDKNINVEIIAQNHKRTIGGIRGRQRTIAYNMYLKNVSIEEIVKITKLDKETITETILKITNPDPTNLGKKWTTEEEYTLLQELDKNINVEIIAQNHKRTIGGITGRQRTIAYNMYLKNVSIEEIIKITKLDKETITETIIKNVTIEEIVKITKLDKETITETILKKKMPPKKVKITSEPKMVSLENEIIEMRTEIKELKNTIKELVEILKIKRKKKKYVKYRNILKCVYEIQEKYIPKNKTRNYL